MVALAGPSLRRLELYWNLKVTDGLLHELAALCPCLAVLNLSGCKEIGNGGVAAVARACPNLTHVDLTRRVQSMVVRARCSVRHRPRSTTCKYSYGCPLDATRLV